MINGLGVAPTKRRVDVLGKEKAVELQEHRGLGGMGLKYGDTRRASL